MCCSAGWESLPSGTAVTPLAEWLVSESEELLELLRGREPPAVACPEVLGLRQWVWPEQQE